MTFKHAKFEDSVIMRSLERVAREKGLVKDEPIQKTASAQVDLTPSDSLMENILNLCAGLRVSGFDKYADELETNYLSYKQATNSLYETDPKAGEKQIRDAHPKGSHKIDGISGDDLAVVETILDEHLKLLDIVNKTPTGKLASSDDVLRAVKKACGAPLNKVDGGALKNVLGQAATPPATSGTDIAKDVGVAVVSTALLNRAINVIKNWRAGMDLKRLAKAESIVQKAIASRNVIHARIVAREAPALTKILGEAYGPNAASSLAKALAPQVGGTAAKAVPAAASAVEKAVVKEVVKDVGVGAATNVAAKGGTWSRLLTMLGGARAGAAAVGATEIGGGTLTGGVAGVTGAGAVGLSALLAAAIVGAIGGAYIGTKLFDTYQEPALIKDAGDLVVERVDSLTEELPIEGKKAAMDFKTAYADVMKNYSVLKDLEENKNPKDLLRLKALNDALLKSNKHAASLWSYGQAELEKQWYNPRGMLGGAWSGLVTKANNYMTRTMDLSNLIQKLVDEIIDKAEVAIKNQPVNPAAPPVTPAETQKVLQGFSDVLQSIKAYKDKINVLGLPNAVKLNTLLDRAAAYTTKYRTKLDTAAPSSKIDPTVLKYFNERLEYVKAKVAGYGKVKGLN